MKKSLRLILMGVFIPGGLISAASNTTGDIPAKAVQVNEIHTNIRSSSCCPDICHSLAAFHRYR